jgi:hypothetical protein
VLFLRKSRLCKINIIGFGRKNREFAVGEGSRIIYPYTFAILEEQSW